MTPYKRHRAAAAILALLFAVAAPATLCRADMALSLDSNTVTFGEINRDNIDAGYKELGASDSEHALRLFVADDSPSGWQLSARAASPTFSSLSAEKPCGDLLWRRNEGGAYTPFDIFDETVAAGSGNVTVDLDFKVRTTWGDTPGSYGMTLVFTLAENI